MYDNHYIAFIHTDDEPGYGISFPDFPGCISQGDTFEDALRLGREALEFHIEGMIEDGDEIPAPSTIGYLMSAPDLAEQRVGMAIASVPYVRDMGSPKRVNISLDPGLLRSIDIVAKSRGMTRSAFLASAARKEIHPGER